MEVDMHNKNPYGVPYDEMIEGAIFYDMWRKQWVILDKPYDASRKSYWLVEVGSDFSVGSVGGIVSDFTALSHLDDLAYDMESEDD